MHLVPCFGRHECRAAVWHLHRAESSYFREFFQLANKAAKGASIKYVRLGGRGLKISKYCGQIVLGVGGVKRLRTYFMEAP